MGLLNSVISAVGGQGGAKASVVAALIKQVNAYPGGVFGLLAKFREGGLGEVGNSWLGAGQNLPVSPSQLLSVLGDSMVGNVAQESGQDKTSVLSILSSVLPALVDKATPDGEPQGGVRLDASLLGSLSGLLGKL